MSNPLRVLIVEDSEDDVLLLRELRRGGFDPVYERVDTPTAMHAALDRQDWDLGISDAALPHFSGLAALALLQERGLDLPFILVSGAIGEERAVAAMRAGAHDYLMKDNLARLAPARLHRALWNLAPAVADHAAMPRAGAPPDQAGIPAAPLILLSEDNEANRAMLSDYLETRGTRSSLRGTGWR
jgi:CheY-like chemotaxis protein